VTDLVLVAAKQDGSESRNAENPRYRFGETLTVL
jgi:hypothetical protein